MESGSFRKKRKNFAQVSNFALMDKTLSIKAKGLYAMIESYISIPDFTLYKDFLMKQSCDGEKSFNSGWKELKEKGYLKIYKAQTPKGFIYEYELLDEPTPPKRTSGKSNVGESNTAVSSSGEEVSKINKQEKEYEENNISYNNTTVEDFFKKVSLDDENQKSFEQIKPRLQALFNVLNEDETLKIASIDNVNDFCLALINLYNDNKITNKEGYIRAILKNPNAFIENYKNKFSEYEQIEIYDASKNPEVSKEEKLAFYKLRYGENYEQFLIDTDEGF